MFSDKSHYLLLRAPGSARIVAFSHFQVVWDDEEEPQRPVLYCFELQVHTDIQVCEQYNQASGCIRWQLSVM